MICVITVLKEDATKFITTHYDVIHKEEYKYCSALTIVSPFEFTIRDLMNLKHPLVIRYTTTNAVTKILYNSKHILETVTVVEKVKPINWKLQFQRHQVNKLLKITG